MPLKGKKSNTDGFTSLSRNSSVVQRRPFLFAAFRFIHISTCCDEYNSSTSEHPNNIATDMPLLLRAKCVLVGDSGVGKSAIAQSFHSERDPLPKSLHYGELVPRTGRGRRRLHWATRASSELQGSSLICLSVGWNGLVSGFTLPSTQPSTHTQTKGVEICVKTVALPDSKDSVVGEDMHALTTCNAHQCTPLQTTTAGDVHL